MFRFLYFRPSPVFILAVHCFRGWMKINLIFKDVTNCLNKNLITHFDWQLQKEKRYDIETLTIDRVLNKEYFSGKIMHKNCTYYNWWCKHTKTKVKRHDEIKEIKGSFSLDGGIKIYGRIYLNRVISIYLKHFTSLFFASFLTVFKYFILPSCYTL